MPIRRVASPLAWLTLRDGQRLIRSGVRSVFERAAAWPEEVALHTTKSSSRVKSQCCSVKMWPCQASTSHRAQPFGTSDSRERRNWHDAHVRTARGAGGGRRALQQDMEQFTAISTLRGIMFLSRGNVYHGSSEFARFHHFEKMLFEGREGGGGEIKVLSFRFRTVR